MPEPAFLVEGNMEQEIVQQICPDMPVRLIGCNSDQASIQKISERILSHIRLLGNRHYPIVIIFDREKRQESSEEIVRNLSKILDAEGCAGQYVIGIPDRTIEAWLMADIDTIINHYSIEKCDFEFEDDEGYSKGTLKKLIGGGNQYHPIVDGVDIFTSSDVDKIYQKSSSFKSFIDKLNEKLTINCRWTAPIK